MRRVQQITNLVLWFITLQIAHSSPEKAPVPETLPLDDYFNRSLDAPLIDILAASSLSKRQLSWDDAIAKGNRLLCRLQNPALLNDQSSVTSTDMLETDGWTRFENEINEDIFPILDSYFAQEGVENNLDDCHAVRWDHNKNSKNSQGQDVPATEGRYANVFNTKVGFILAYSNFSPAWMVRTKENKILPDIRAWSDVVFLEWQKQAQANGHDVQGLKYVFRYEVINPETVMTAERAAGPSFKAEWPGITFSMSDERGQAMLGTPNGAGIGYLLATHKEQLGDKTIETVQAWWQAFQGRSLTVHILHLAFRIGPVASSSGPSTTE